MTLKSRRNELFLENLKLAIKHSTLTHRQTQFIHKLYSMLNNDSNWEQFSLCTHTEINKNSFNLTKCKKIIVFIRFWRALISLRNLENFSFLVYS